MPDLNDTPSNPTCLLHTFNHLHAKLDLCLVGTQNGAEYLHRHVEALCSVQDCPQSCGRQEPTNANPSFR